MIYRKEVIIFIFVGVKFSFEPPANENDEILHQTKISRYTVFAKWSSFILPATVKNECALADAQWLGKL